jgi:tRNA wybutosine-synthesizing protein 3
MCRWEALGDIIILPKTCFKDPLWESVSEELWPLVAKALGAQRLARQVSKLLVCWLWK